MFLSIICPCYNVEKYLEDCINSVAMQNIGNFEMILIDDGSKDSTPILCDNLAKKFNFIKVLHKTNGGASSARNAGLKIAKGEKILFLDSDDLLFDGALEGIKNVVSKNKDILYLSFNHGIVDTELNKPIIYSASITEGVRPKNDFLREFFNHNQNSLPWTPWQNIYDLAYIKKNNLCFNESLPTDEDYLFNFEYLKNIKKVYHSNIPLVKYRMNRPGSLTTNIKTKNVLNSLKNRAFMFNNCEPEMSDIFASLYMSIFVIIDVVKDKADRKMLLENVDVKILNSVTDKKSKLIATFYKLFGFNFTMFCCKIMRSFNKIKRKLNGEWL